jgi:hypothetical protein
MLTLQYQTSATFNAQCAAESIKGQLVIKNAPITAQACIG